MSKKYILSLTFMLAVSFAGCDMIDSIKDNFSKEPKESVSPPVSPKPAAQASQPLAGNVLARIGSWTITQNEFEERLKALKEIVPDYDVSDPEARKLVLEELIRQQLIVMEAEATGLAKQKDIVAAVDEFRRTLLVREAARELTENINVTEEEALEFYLENKDQIVEPFQYSVSEIVVPTKVKASEVYLELLKGGNFAEAARLHSTSASAANGGSLGVLTEDPFEEMVTQILALEEGGISEVFKGPNGFYIVRLDSKTGGNQVPFEDVQDEIIQNRTLFKQQQAILDYINRLRSKTKIDINESLLN